MIDVTLADGRVLGIEAVMPHEAMRIAEGCRELSGNRRWWRTAMAVAAVRTINGIANPLPTHKNHIEGLCGRFDKADMAAIVPAANQWQDIGETHEFEFRQLSTLEDLKISELAEECCDVPGWIGPAMLAATLRKVDGQDVAFPVTRDELREAVKRLGQMGMVKAAAFMLKSAEDEKAKIAAKKASAKN